MGEVEVSYQLQKALKNYPFRTSSNGSRIELKLENLSR